MKKSQLRNIIRESVKELMNEQSINNPQFNCNERMQDFKNFAQGNYNINWGGWVVSWNPPQYNQTQAEVWLCNQLNLPVFSQAWSDIGGTAQPGVNIGWQGNLNQPLNHICGKINQWNTNLATASNVQANNLQLKIDIYTALKDYVNPVTNPQSPYTNAQLGPNC